MISPKEIEERVALLEKKQSDMEDKLVRLINFARLHPTGRLLLKALGL